jgi:hypothetical protein
MFVKLKEPDYFTEYSDYVTGWSTGESRFVSQQGQRLFLFPPYPDWL